MRMSKEITAGEAMGAGMPENVRRMTAEAVFVEFHGTSGIWRRAYRGFASVREAEAECDRLRADGFGARIAGEGLPERAW